jgi:uncharacterized membrane protein SpoIIM required for sporulation
MLTAAVGLAMGTDMIAAVKAETDRALAEIDGLLAKALANVSSEVGVAGLTEALLRY